MPMLIQEFCSSLAIYCCFYFCCIILFSIFLLQTTRIFKNYSIYSEKAFVYASDTIIAFLALIVSLLHVINKNKIYFVFDDYLTAFYYLFIIFCLITFIVYLSLKILKKNKLHFNNCNFFNYFIIFHYLLKNIF